jgi:N6-adenosine-specific RNA methylase IME4
MTAQTFSPDQIATAAERVLAALHHLNADTNIVFEAEIKRVANLPDNRLFPHALMQLRREGRIITGRGKTGQRRKNWADRVQLVTTAEQGGENDETLTPENDRSHVATDQFEKGQDHVTGAGETSQKAAPAAFTRAAARLVMPTLLLPAHASAGPFPVIYADPPWQFRVWSKDTGQGRSAEAHYPTMTIDDICALPVVDLTAPDAALFMWATWPTLPDALRLGTAWGFEYKTLAFDFLKLTRAGRGWHVGMGYYTRANTEPCLLFTKGKPKRRSRKVRQLIVDGAETQPTLFELPIIAPLGDHSAKPYEAYRRIERLFEGPYLELFARTRWPGWVSVGNDLDGVDIRISLNQLRSQAS